MSIRCAPVRFAIVLCVWLLVCCLGAVADPRLIRSTNPLSSVSSAPPSAQSGAELQVQQVAFFEDASGMLSSADILAPPCSERFIVHPHGIRSFGFTASAVWGRIQLKALKATEAGLQLSTTRLDHVTWYEVRDHRVVRSIRNGWLDGPPESAAPQQHPAISLRLRENETCIILFRVASDCSLTLPLLIADSATFAEISARRLYSSHLQVGASIASVCFCLLLAISLRDWGFAMLTFCCVVGVCYGLLFDTVLSFPGVSIPRWASRLGCSLATTSAAMSMLAFSVSYNGWQLLSGSDRKLTVGVTVASLIFLVLQFLIHPRVTHQALGFFVCLSESCCMWLFTSPWRRHRRREDLLVAIGVFVIHLPALLLVLQLEHVLPTVIAPQQLRFVMTPTVVCGLICAMLRKRYLTEQLKLRVAQAQAGESDARLAALRYQLNPHMLLNSLTAVSSLSRSQPERVPPLIDSLAVLLQSRLKPAPGEFWTLVEELQLVRSLVDLERARFDDRLVWKESIDAAAESCLLPDMLLQPLIENALKYSREGSDAPQVWLEAAVSGRHLIVKVTNNCLLDKQLSKGNGIGIANIRNRLELHYGSSAKFHFQISSRQATVEVQLPLRQSA